MLRGVQLDLLLHIHCAVLPDPCKPSLPLLAKSTATWGPFKANKFFLSLPHSQPYSWLPFLPLFFRFSTQILLLLVSLALSWRSCCCWDPCCCQHPCCCLLSCCWWGCHKLVSDSMAHGHFHGHQFSTDIQLACCRREAPVDPGSFLERRASTIRTSRIFQSQTSPARTSSCQDSTRTPSPPARYVVLRGYLSAPGRYDVLRGHLPSCQV
jgi:hypothetical protein